MNPTELPLSRHGAVQIAARVLCIVFVFYALLNLLALPSYIVGIFHYKAHTDTDGYTYWRYWTSRYMEYTLSALLKGTVELWVAGVFYRVGPRVTRFFLGEDVEPKALPTTEEN
jgi:hypothetical protein